ncbi:hypothetical protein FE246_08295 [Aliarcobacter thereius]|uniref:Uncharacterized protein n=1 Tax=Aliarcobacter thereius TaxID=544718 RepID=A0A5R9H4F5_9BACT|nr:hypothetical protein [Aliarcobacter thereius]TLS70958.1 hypothetical protein FE246_08295 [Aliarcobacter thereius]
MAKRIDEKMLLRAEPILAIGQKIDDFKNIIIEINLLDKNKKPLTSKPLKKTIPKAEKTKDIKNILKEYNSEFKGEYIIKDITSAKEVAKKLEIEETDKRYSQISYLSFRIDANCSGKFDKSEAEKWFDVEIVKTHLYFIFYDTKGNHIYKIQKAIKKLSDEVNKEIEPKGKHHKLYVKHISSKYELEAFYKEKVNENGGDKNVIIELFDAVKIEPENSIFFQKVQDKLGIKANLKHLQPTGIFQENDKISQQVIDEYNQNILRNEKLHKTISSKEHKKYVLLKVADDLEDISNWSGGLLVGSLLMMKYLPATLPITLPASTTTATISFSALIGKSLFKYFADEFLVEELVVDIVLSKTVYCKNSILAEYFYDQTFSTIAEYFYGEIKEKRNNER